MTHAKGIDSTQNGQVTHAPNHAFWHQRPGDKRALAKVLFGNEFNVI